MCLISLHCFLELSVRDVARCFEGARDDGQLLFLDSADKVMTFKNDGRRILFFSYTWLSWHRLGPNEQQLAVMQRAARYVCTTNRIEAEKLYVWLDVLSIPQANVECKALAVASLYVYASQSDYMVVVCPQAVHEDSGELSGPEAVKSRLWCRVEQVAHCCNNGLQGMYTCTEDQDPVSITKDWIRDVMHVFDGELTCCRKCYPDGGQCDRELLVPSGLAMYADLLWKYRENILPEDTQMTVWPMIVDTRESIFPKTFSYRTRGRRGVRSKRRFLFGSMMDSVADIVSNPDFCPTLPESAISGAFRMAEGAMSITAPTSSMTQRLRMLATGRASVTAFPVIQRGRRDSPWA
eukprot:TRINITY_DN17980_c0_g2_i1.p1 TRINITY_DN17980_c0_g2~~TRINITY_DN17980_c0_g2_i1.p1  ORF type:complete len:351 (-),score=29.01 TRINITY_DN17980_c0_g2_i1:67-1119(-)